MPEVSNFIHKRASVGTHYHSNQPEATAELLKAKPALITETDSGVSPAQLPAAPSLTLCG